MSIPVALERLREEVARSGGRAYVLTAGEDGRPHAVGVEVIWRGELLTAAVGARTAANAAARPLVTLLWPPVEEGGYSLIVDASSDVDDGELLLRPTKGVLHRAARGDLEPAPGACGSDCVPVLAPDAPR